MIFKCCARCGKLVRYGQRYCDGCVLYAQTEAEQAKRLSLIRYNRQRDPKYAALYNSKAWELLRDRVLLECEYTCERCGGVMATEVHHVVPLSEDWSRRYDRANLVGLCFDCHNAAHARFTPRGGDSAATASAAGAD